MTEIKNMFEISTETSNALPHTEELVTSCNKATADILAFVNENVEEYGERLQNSSSSINEMDALIKTLLVDTALVAAPDVSFLDTATEDELVSILRSQQSKRSRCRGAAVMTLDIFKKMMSAAIAEYYLRSKLGKDKTKMGRASSELFTEEELVALSEDQEELRRELRNIQSKKSIYKRREDFSEESEVWQTLLANELALKDIRITRLRTSKRMDMTAEALRAALGERDIDGLKAAEAREILRQLLALSDPAPEAKQTMPQTTDGVTAAEA